MTDDDLPWKKIALSLERPYKGMRTLEDITQDGQLTYEREEEPAKVLGTKLRQIFAERGVDFFEKTEDGLENMPPLKADLSQEKDGHLKAVDESDGQGPVTMSTEELFKMRMEIAPQLFIAMGEMTHAKELLSALLSARAPLPLQTLLAAEPPAPTPTTPSIINATTVTKPPGIPSVEAFNAQLILGSRDEALRKAATTFKLAAESMERGRVKSEQYWTDALKVRRTNWSLVPAPLPYASSFVKGADKTAKDFLISFGLEESPVSFRRRALAQMAGQADKEEGLVFPLRQRTRLRITLRASDATGFTDSQNYIPIIAEDGVEDSLREAQQEIIEQEIFSILVKEASHLPTAGTRVSERLIVVEAAEKIELRFDLVERGSSEVDNRSNSGQCDLIHSALYALLLRQHAHLKSSRLGPIGVLQTTTPTTQPPSTTQPLILRPIIDLIQYKAFCHRLKVELDQLCSALSDAKVPAYLRFDFVGDIGRDLMRFLTDTSGNVLSGEAVLRIDHRYTLRLTLTSPSTLFIHLPQVTQPITSMPQLYQLLSDEIERYLLTRICGLGKALTQDAIGSWFVDLVTNRCVGKLEGQFVNFSVIYQTGNLRCMAFRMHKETRRETLIQDYTSKDGQGLFEWVEGIAQKVSPQNGYVK